MFTIDSSILNKIFYRLFYHECLRVFHDRLINVEDKSYFYRLMSTVCQKNFQQPILDVPDEPIIENPPMLLFGDFLNSSVPKENRVYAEIPDMFKLTQVLKVNLLYMSCNYYIFYFLYLWYENA